GTAFEEQPLFPSTVSLDKNDNLLKNTAQPVQSGDRIEERILSPYLAQIPSTLLKIRLKMSSHHAETTNGC
ncbi:hypothetical protein, partial [Kaarinaea lacus]